jgi:hypothetical protein
MSESNLEKRVEQLEKSSLTMSKLLEGINESGKVHAQAHARILQLVSDRWLSTVLLAEIIVDNVTHSNERFSKNFKTLLEGLRTKEDQSAAALNDILKQFPPLPPHGDASPGS